MSPLKQKIHKSLSCIFNQLPADGNPGFIVQDKQGSIKINSMLQMGKMFCLYNMSNRNLYIASIYFYIYVFSGIRDPGKNLIDQV